MRWVGQELVGNEGKFCWKTLAHGSVRLPSLEVTKSRRVSIGRTGGAERTRCQVGDDGIVCTSSVSKSNWMLAKLTVRLEGTGRSSFKIVYAVVAVRSRGLASCSFLTAWISPFTCFARASRVDDT